jgi:tetratricopeptide (TPR) repeat protein
MTEQRSGRKPDKTNRPWLALFLYLAAGWAAAEVLLTVRERFGLPEVLDNLVLGMLLAGLAGCVLLLATGGLARRSPLLTVSRILGAAVVASAVALGISGWLGQGDDETDIPSVAVLPCDYEGVDDHAFLGPAAAQEVHAKLAKVASVQIPSWRSVLKSVRIGKDSQQVAQILRVGHLTRCRITKDEDAIELSASIVDTETQEPVWSGRQTYASADLVQAISDISLAITDALSARLTADESDRLTRAPTSSPEAYEHYLRGRQAQGGSHWYIPNLMSALEIDEKGYELAMAHYRQAVELDPDFAEAWAGMATATWGYGNNVKGEDTFGSAMKAYGEQAHEFASRALEHDSCNAEALLLIDTELWWMFPSGEEPPAADAVWQSDPAWAAQSKRADPFKIVKCEPNNATAWRVLADGYASFNVNPADGTEYPAESMRAALMKALALDPTDCGIQEYYINTFRHPFYAPRPEDRLSVDEAVAAVRSALLVNPECGALHQILAEIAIGQGRFDEAIAWHMRRHELAPDNPHVGVCEISLLLYELGLVEEANAWASSGREAGFYWCFEQDVKCFQSRPAYFGEGCKAQRLETAERIMSSDWGTASPGILVFKYRQAMYEAQTSDRPDLVRQWLDEGLEMLDTDDPVAILGKNPKRKISARNEGLELVPIFRDLGLHDDAGRMLELCRRDPDDPDQIVFGMDNTVYVDARHLSLAGRKAEAMNALTRAVREHQTFSGYLSPGRHALLFDRALDPLREDPEYAPQIERLLEEQEAWLAPARERAAKALETGDWASLRTLIETPPGILARSE